MKKAKWFGLILVFIMLFSVVFPSPMHASAMEDTRTWYYSVLPGDEEWKGFGAAEAYKACNMPEELLAKCSTDELADLLLDYPFILGILGYDKLEWGFEYLERASNIFREYFSRADAIDMLLLKYDELDVNYDMLVNDYKTVELVLADSGYEKELFLQIYFGFNIDVLSEQQRMQLKTTTGEKYEQKKEKGVLDIFSSTALIIYSTIQNKYGEIPRELVPDNIYNDYAIKENDNTNLAIWYFNDCGYWDDWHNYGYYHAYATQNPPTDPSSFCLKLHGDDDYDSASKISLNASWLASRPWLDYAGPVTRVYNCHAYAWIVPEYWLEDPLPFKNTIYFTWRTTNGAADDDWKIIFKNGSVVTHSAVVLYGGADADSIYVIQKMGTMGLYMTYLDSLLYTDYPGDYYTFSGS